MVRPPGNRLLLLFLACQVLIDFKFVLRLDLFLVTFIVLDHGLLRAESHSTVLELAELGLGTDSLENWRFLSQ